METKKELLSDLELRSESVQNILSKPPNLIVRLGSIIILIIILAFIIMSFVIKYPETVSSPITIKSKYPPEILNAKINAKIEDNLVKNHQKISKGQIIAVLQSSADYKDVLELKTILDSIKTNGILSFQFQKMYGLQLGEVQEAFNSFLEILNKEQELVGSSPDKLNKSLVYKRLYLYTKLQKSILDWEKKYFIVSTTNGTSNFKRIWKKNETVKKGDVIATILPSTTNVIGNMEVSPTNASKVKVGQKVFVRLDNYNQQEFGLLEARVENISYTLNNHNNYDVNILFYKGLETSYKKQIPSDRELIGNAQIITKDLRLIDHLFKNYSDLIK